jgi:hypothetical protein
VRLAFVRFAFRARGLAARRTLARARARPRPRFGVRVFFFDFRARFGFRRGMARA